MMTDLAGHRPVAIEDSSLVGPRLSRGRIYTSEAEGSVSQIPCRSHSSRGYSSKKPSRSAPLHFRTSVTKAALLLHPWQNLESRSTQFSKGMWTCAAVPLGHVCS